MTIHQAKGLEFPVVFVYGLKNKKQVDSSIKLEEKLYKFRKNKPITKLSSDEKSEQDTIRRYYVAYSRAQYALIHLVPKTHFKTHSNNGDGYVGFIGKSVSKFLDYMPCLDNGQKPLTKWIR
jgi:DNA helicase-2/ATP-dependent DNA helicase PcrA